MSIMDMAFLAITIWVPALAGLLIVMPDWLLSLFDTPRRIARRTPKPLADDDWNDQNRPEKLNYNYIDWLERDLEIGKYDPDRIAIEIETQAEEAAAMLGLGMDEEDWREALTKYHGMSADEILRGIPYGTHGLIVQQSRSRGESNGWAFDYRIYVIGEVARREVRDRQLEQSPRWRARQADPEIDELPMETPGQFSAEESAALVDRLLGDLNELNAKIGAKPVDDSWADVDVRDGVYGPETRGLVKRIVDNNGNWSEIRSFGS